MLEALGGTRFEIKRQLGAGGMGVVYDALDRETGEHVALKTLHNITAQSLYRFKNEFRALRGLYHPNLVRLGELHGQGDAWFFTMELVDGVNVLLDVRPRRIVPRPVSRAPGPRASDAAVNTIPDVEDPGDPTPGSGTAPDVLSMKAPPAPREATLVRSAVERVDEPTDIGRGVGEDAFDHAANVGGASIEAEVDWEKLRARALQIAEALIALHDAGKVHRDLKPSNVMVTRDGRVVLLDFGLVLEAHTDAGENTDENVAGTIAYMAPEQATQSTTGPAADWYALGVMLYQLISGRLPFQGPPAEVIADKKMGPPGLPRATVGRAPPDLAQLAVDLMHPKPEARPSGDEVRRRLARRAGASSRPPRSSSGESPISGALGVLGRQAELEVLRGAFERALAKRPASVVITGATGIGKSTLATQFVEDVRRERPETILLRSRCRRDELVPFQAIDGVIDGLSHSLLRLPETRVARLLPPRLALLVEIFPVLRRVPSIEALASQTFDLPPNERRAAAFEALRELLVDLAVEWPVIVLIDDLEFIDRDSATELEKVFSGDGAPSTLLITTSRPFEEADDQAYASLGLPTSTRKLELEPLSTNAARALVELLHPSIDSSSIPDLVAAGAGHPQLLHELVRHARAHPGRGAVTLEEALAARVGALDETAGAVLEIAAIAGGVCPESVLARAIGRDVGAVRATLGPLEAARLVRVEREGTRVLVEPENERIKVVVERRLGDARGAEVRAKLLAALDAEPEAATYDDIAVRLLETLGRSAEAARRLLVAADAAEERLAFDRVAGLLVDALRVGSFERDEERGICERAARCLSWAGNLGDAGRQLERAANLASEGFDRANLLAAAAHQHAAAYDAVGMQRAATGAYAALGKTYPATKSQQTWGIVRVMLALLFAPVAGIVARDDAQKAAERRVWHSLSMSMQIGSYVTTDMLLGALATFASIYQGLRLGASIERVRGLWMESIVLVTAKLIGAAKNRIRKMQEVASQLDRTALGTACFGNTITQTKLGEFEAAEEEAERGLAYAPWMDAFEYVGMTTRVGLVLAMTGHVERGLAWTRRGLARVRANVKNDLLETVRDTVVVKLAILGRTNDGEARFTRLLAEHDWTHGRVQVGIGMGLLWCYESEHDGPLVDALLRAHQTAAVPANHPADEDLLQYVLAPYIHARRALSGVERSTRELHASLKKVRKVTDWRMLAPHRPILEAAWMLVEGDPEGALLRLDAAERIARETNNPWATFESISMRVRCFIRMGFERDARLHFRMAVALAEEQRWTRRVERITNELGRLLDRD